MTIDITTHIESLISNDIALSLSAACGDPRIAIVIKKIAPDIALKFTVQANSFVSNDLQQNIGNFSQVPQGLFSPLNTTISNIAAIDVSTLTQQYVTSTVADSLSAYLISSIQSAIIQTVHITIPPILTSQLLNRLLVPLVQNSVQLSIGNVIDSFVNTTYENYSTPIAIIDGLNIPSIGISLSLDDLLGKATQNIQNKIVNEVQKEASLFNVFNNENSKKLRALTQGFVDPNAVYPSVTYQGIADTNKLAQGIISGTIVQDKFNNRMIGAKLPNGDSFSEPQSTYKAKYPHNKVMESTSGHVVEIDDTPGAERIHIYHKSGTYYEIDSFGNTFHRSKGSEFTIIDKNNYISIAGSGHLSVSGEMKVMICGNADIEVTGNTTVNCYNDMELNAAGRLALTAGEAIDMHAPNIYIEADNQLHITADEYSRQEYQKLDILVHDTTRVTSTNDIDITSNSNIHVSTATDFMIKSANNIVYDATGSVSNKAGTIINASSGNISNTATGNITGNSGGIVAFDGTNIYLNSGSSSAVAGLSSNAPVAANEASYSQAGIIDAREDFVNITIEDSFPDNFVDEASYQSDDLTDIASNKAVQQDLIKNGLAQASDFNDVGVSTTSDTSAATSNIPYVQPDKKLLSLQQVPPDNFMLSTHFSLGMLSSQAPAQHNRVKAQNGLSIGQIVYNLSDVANNCLEQVYSAYPNMIVTSGFRNAEESLNPNSLHMYGLAVDIQLQGLPKSQYYNVAKNIKNLLNNYQELILEFKSSGAGNPWLHLGLRSASGQQNKNVFTMFNHKVYGQGLTNIV